MKRTFGGIQFTFVDPHWISADGIRLFCGTGLRGPLSNHWEIELPTGMRTSGMSALDALQNVGVVARPEANK